MDGSWGEAQPEAHRPSVGGLDKQGGGDRGVSGPWRLGSASLRRGLAWSLHVGAKGGGEESGHGSPPGTSGVHGREGRPRGPGDRHVRRGVQATPEMGNGRAHSTAGPRRGPGTALERHPGHEEGQRTRLPLQFVILAPKLGPGAAGLASVLLRAVTLALPACIEVCWGLRRVDRLVGAVLL